MTSPDLRADLSAEDRRLVDHIRRDYAAPPMSAVDHTRFDARLRARIERQRRRRWGLAGLALAGAAAAVALFALRQPTELPAGEPGVLPAMASSPTAADAGSAVAETQSITLDWLVADSAADWLGGTTVLPADPLALPTLDDGQVAAAADDAEDAADDTDDDADGPAYLPDEYTVLAGLIEIEPYDPYAEDWP